MASIFTQEYGKGRPIDLIGYSVLVFVGSFGIFWYIFWLMVSYESPAKHPTITEEEKKYIEESIGESAGLMNPLMVSICNILVSWPAPLWCFKRLTAILSSFIKLLI